MRHPMLVLDLAWSKADGRDILPPKNQVATVHRYSIMIGESQYLPSQPSNWQIHLIGTLLLPTYLRPITTVHLITSNRGED